MPRANPVFSQLTKLFPHLSQQVEETFTISRQPEVRENKQIPHPLGKESAILSFHR